MKYILAIVLPRTTICTLIFLWSRKLSVRIEWHGKKSREKKKSQNRTQHKRKHTHTHKDWNACTHLKYAQGHKSIRFNCWWHFLFFVYFSVLFLLCPIQQRDFVIVYLNCVRVCVCGALASTPGRVFAFVFRSHKNCEFLHLLETKNALKLERWSSLQYK